MIRIRNWTFLLLLIIPIVIPTSTEYHIVCPICDTILETVSSHDAKLLKNGINTYTPKIKEPEYCTDVEAKEIVIITMKHLPELKSTMIKAKSDADLVWLNKFISDQKNIDHLKYKLKKYGDGIFENEDVIKYIRWYYQEIL